MDILERGRQICNRNQTKLQTMKKIYIAGKITGIEEEARLLFEEAEFKLWGEGWQPVNPMKLDHNHGKTWAEYMRLGVAELMKCEALFALSNWKDSEGAKIEIRLAKEVGIKIIYQDEKAR